MRHLRKSIAFVVATASLTTLLFAGAHRHGSWMAKVPEKSRGRNNPFAGNAEAAKAGEKLFGQHCAQCHGANAEGKKGPSLRSHHIEHTTAGELEWLLTNGSLKDGMPSWSRLPEPQRWQLVTYLKSLQ
jgi:mono/diheme cytochrome c family protein